MASFVFLADSGHKKVVFLTSVSQLFWGYVQADIAWWLKMFPKPHHCGHSHMKTFPAWPESCCWRHCRLCSSIIKSENSVFSFHCYLGSFCESISKKKKNRFHQGETVFSLPGILMHTSPKLDLKISAGPSSTSLNLNIPYPS